MRKCRSCGRELLVAEKKYCPACSSKKSHGWKRPVGVGTALVAIVAFVGAAVWKAVVFGWKTIRPS